MPTDIATIDDQGQLLLHFHPGQMQAWESEARFVAVMSGTQGGKALSLDTIIPTLDGFTTMGELKEGDTVFGGDGSPCKVLHKSEVFHNHDCFEVHFIDSLQTIIADADHLWKVRKTQPHHSDVVATRDLWMRSIQCLNGRLLYVGAVIPTKSVPVQCISVDSVDNTYLCTHDNIPTHNTSWGPFWLWREIQRRGPGDYMIVAPAYPLLSKKCLPEFLKLFKRHLDLGSYNTQSKIFTFSDDGCQRTFGYIPDVPTQVFFCHAQDPESLESATAKAAWLDEAGQKKFKLGSWEAILRRLSIHQGRVLITTTPYDLGWLKQKIYDKRNDPAESIEVIRFDSTANPTFPREEWERAMRDLPRWKFDMFYRAIFTRPAGMIYDCFQEDRHKVKPFKVPDDWPRYLGLDFGAVNTAGIFLAKEPNTSRLYAYREYKAGGKTMGLHVKDLLDGEPCHPLVCGGAQSEENWRMECRQAGLMIYEPPIKEVEVGIDRVYGAFQRDELFIFDNCSGLLQDIKSYSRALDDMGEPTEKIAEKETYHYADALRYIISKVRGPKSMREPSETPRAREPVAKNSVDGAARGTFTTKRPGRGAKW